MHRVFENITEANQELMNEGTVGHGIVDGEG